LLREDVIPATGKTKAEIAQLLGISRQHLYDILRERKPVSPGVAVRFGKLFGDGAGVWVRMQAAYDTWQRRERGCERNSHAPPRAAMKHRLPMPAMLCVFGGTGVCGRVSRHNFVQNRRVRAGHDSNGCTVA